MKTLNSFIFIIILVTFVNCFEILGSSLIIEKALAAISGLSSNEDIKVSLIDTQVKAYVSGEILIDEEDENFVACQNEQNEYLECFNETDNMNDEEECKLLNGERCKKMFNDPATHFPSCAKYDSSLAKGVYGYYKLLGSIYGVLCANQRNCKIAKDMVDKLPDILNGELEAIEIMSPSDLAIKDDCHHKECVDSAIDMYEKEIEILEINMEINKEKGIKIDGESEEMVNYNNAMNILNENLKQLRSQACVQLNGTAKLTASNILLFSIITLVFLYLL